MHRRAPATLLLLLAVALPAGAAPDLTSAERKAQRETKTQLLKLARYATKENAWDAALGELRLGLELWPDSSKLARELERTEKKADADDAPTPTSPRSGRRSGSPPTPGSRWR